MGMVKIRREVKYQGIGSDMIRLKTIAVVISKADSNAEITSFMEKTDK